MAASPTHPRPVDSHTSRTKAKDTRRGRLNVQQARFCRQYAYDVMGNATKAAIAAGYSKDTASAQAAVLLNLPKVQDEIARLQVRQLQKTELLVAATVTELARLAFSDPRNFFDAEGNPLPVHELPDDIAAALASFEIETKQTKRTRDDDAGETIERSTIVTKYKLWSKPEALAMMGKYTGILREKDNAAASDTPTRTEVTITLVQAQPRQPDPVAELEPTRATIQQPANYGSAAAVEVKLIGAAGQNGPDGTT